jgi:ribosome-associated protein
MIQVTPTIAIDENEIQMEFIRSSGPGGQKVNKTSSAVQLRFDVGNSPSLPDNVRSRLVHLAGRRITEDGILIINARRFRTQVQNRQDALDRLVALIQRSAKKPKPRLKTRLSAASKKRRLELKRRHSEIKRKRKFVQSNND